MKGAVAALTAAFARLSQHRDAFRGRITLTLVADETVFGPDGAGYLLENRPDLLGDAVICGEGPGAMTLAVAEKGVLWLELSCRVPSGQGMLTVAGASAIARLSRVIAEIDRWNDEQVTPPPELAAVCAQRRRTRPASLRQCGHDPRRAFREPEGGPVGG